MVDPYSIKADVLNLLVIVNLGLSNLVFVFVFVNLGLDNLVNLGLDNLIYLLTYYRFTGLLPSMVYTI